MVSCPKCARILMDTLADGSTRIRTRLLLFGENGDTKAACPACKTAVALPITVRPHSADEKSQRKPASIKHVIVASETQKKTANPRR